uniref:Craniofacial development protein 1 n=1 Tax=Heterorhabditis bacteriophora TaxID=37862 RepID=A0A1I7XH12_HETBA
MADQDSEYNSSDDEDYIPEDFNDVGEPSGDEVDEGSAEDDIILSAVKKSDIQSDTLRNNLNPSTVRVPETQKDVVDVDAIFASLMEEQDPLLITSSNLTLNCKPDTRYFLEKLLVSYKFLAHFSYIRYFLSHLKMFRDNSAIVVNESGPSSLSDVLQSDISDSRKKTTMIMEVFDFAGDEVKIQREVTFDELRQHETNIQKKEKALKKGPQKRMGLDGALTLLSKKPKLSVLDKSNHDWKSFKEENKLETDEEEKFVETLRTTMEKGELNMGKNECGRSGVKFYQISE